MPWTPNYFNKWRKTAGLEWTNTFYPTFKIRKREGSRYTLKHYRLTEARAEGDTLLANFRNLQDAKRYAEDIISQSAKVEVTA